MDSFETLDPNMDTDTSNLGEVRKPQNYCYDDHLPFILLKGLEIYSEHLGRRKRKRRRLPRVHYIKADKEYGAGFVSREIRQSPAPASLNLQMEEKHRVLSLTDVTILPKVGGETIVGTLEAHVNGFIYTASIFRMQFLLNNIKTSLFRLGDKSMPPLIHFHLQDSIMIGEENTKDIQFQLVHCPVGDMLSENDSDKKPIRDGGRNQDLKNFVVKVEDQWTAHGSSYFFEKIDKDYEFYGVLPSEKPAAFALTLFSLIVLVVTPFIVVPLGDIDIVNLALLRPGEINMTVVLQDFKEDVIEINSIPLEALVAIEQTICHVQYYVNAEKLDWKSIVKGRADFPEKFIENGGWNYFKLEDRAYYMETKSNKLSISKEMILMSSS